MTIYKHPDVYDSVHATKDYEGEVEFVLERFEEYGNGGDRVLVVGCGTGEHSRRLEERGFDVTGVDKSEAMIEHARTKSTADFRVGALPEFGLEDSFDLILMPFTILNHLDPADLESSIRTLVAHLSQDGILVFDNQNMPDEPKNRILPFTHDGKDGASMLNFYPKGGKQYQWAALVFPPDRDRIVNCRTITDFTDEEVEALLEESGLAVETYEGYTDQLSSPPTVFVAR